MKNLRDGSKWLWAALILCVVYIVLWVAGVRFPFYRIDRTAVSEQEVEWYDDAENDEDLDEEDSGSDIYDDFELPAEPEAVDDGRTPGAILL